MFMHKAGDGSKTALLIHGMASSSATWDKLRDDLVKRDFTVYAPDLPGHGEAERATAATYTLDSWKNLLLDQVESVDLLVGHSIGGLLALMVKGELKPQATVLEDPMLHFPKGFIGRLSREFFSVTQLIQNAPLLHNWDKGSALMLLTPHSIPKPREDTLIVRAPRSFVAPRGLMKSLDKTEIFTMPKANHNIHRDFYDKFFEVMRDFVVRRGLFTS